MTLITCNKTAIASVILRKGFVLRIARGIKAYTADECSIGLFRTKDEAVAAILEKAAANVSDEIPF